MVKKRHILHKKTPSGGQFQSMQVPTNKVCRVQKLISTKDNEETLKNELKAKCEQIKDQGRTLVQEMKTLRGGGGEKDKRLGVEAEVRRLKGQMSQFLVIQSCHLFIAYYQVYNKVP
eukprot:TRINITY_DN11666_c0_g1_i1.p1 TRINITY_DN11666_c0_g1~~TRINITY_DN11666_c0_g1_i1.p1  ORF type:complete len:117 (-),score=22.73 TRINITY_DN11666_c0_g1_i1:197-547(-)